MDINYVSKLLTDFKTGNLTLDEAVDKLKILPYEELEFAKLDHHRLLRQGFAEVVFCQGKTVEQVLAIVNKLAEYNRAFWQPERLKRCMKLSKQLFLMPSTMNCPN